MKLRLDLLKRQASLPNDAREDVAVCLGEVARLDRLVESLLSVGRARAKPDQHIDLAALVDGRITAAFGLAREKRVSLSRSGSGAVDSEPDAVAAALDNLLRNAIEASPDGAAVIVRIAGGPGGVSLEVEDRGPGIADARRNELFEPFFSTKSDGTGLGLWMSRLMLEARGATLGYDRRGDVTRMRIQFPPDGSDHHGERPAGPDRASEAGGAWRPS
jgi:signal transduction histidine kinase